jgi:hypothetical protein
MPVRTFFSFPAQSRQHLALTVWTRISGDILKHVDANKTRRLEWEQTRRRNAAQSDLRPFYILSKQAFESGGNDGDFPGFANFTKLRRPQDSRRRFLVDDLR